MLSCPGCAGRLSRRATDKGAVYACATCGGRAVAMGVLRRTTSQGFLRDLWQQAAGAPRLPGRPCPHCHRPMAAVTPPDTRPPVVLDVCRSCQIVWFDRKEYEAVAPEQPVAAPAGAEELSSTEAEAVGLVKLQSQRELAKLKDQRHSMQGWQWLPAILGLPVEFNDAALARRPILTWGLSLVMAVLFLGGLLAGSGEQIIKNWGFIPAQWARHGGLTILTSFFLHADVWHLIGNLYFFLIFGDNVEDHLGHGAFLLLLGASHLAGVLLHCAYDPRGDVPVVGASAGISGVIAYYAILFPKAKIGMLLRFWLIPIYWFRMSVVTALVLYVLLQFVGAYAQIKGFSSVSALGHLGGLTVGIVAATAVRLMRSDPAMKRR